METIKKGSKGEAVKTLQERLGITADGIFGNNTEQAVKDFQRKHGLTIDGVVGAKTWQALGVTDTDSQELKIEKAYIDTHITRYTDRPIRYIAVHYTAGSSSKAGSAKSTRNVFLKRKASADFVVDDETIVQINPNLKSYYCWSVGDSKNIYSSGGSLYGKATNRNTISIEICSNLKKGANASKANHAGWYFTESALNLTRALIRYLMDKYNIPKERVVRHYDVSGKLCPGIIGWNNESIYTEAGEKTKDKSTSKAWEEFWKSI